MDFTGERFMPELGYESEMGIEHMQRYLSIIDLVRGKVVLDIACGEGYGTHIISKYAEKVYGMDISKEAIDNANNKYVEKNLSFCESSVDSINLNDNSLDVVVSFETIEHLNEELQEKFMLEVKRVLKKEGILIISSPNKEIYSDKFNYTNKFHIREFYEHEFSNFLARHFSNVNYSKQCFEVSSLLVGEKPTDVKIIDLEADNGLKAKYNIAVCSNITGSEQLITDSIILNTPYSFIEQMLRIIELQDKTKELSEWGKDLDKQISIYVDRISTLNKDNENLQQNVSKLRSENSRLLQVVEDVEIKNAVLENENERLGINNKLLTDEREQLTYEKDKLTSEKDKLAYEKDELTSERDKLTYEKDKLASERDMLAEEKNRLSLELKSIYNSNFWKLALKYYWIVDNVWPFKELYKYIRKAKEKRLIRSENVLNQDIINKGSSYVGSNYEEISDDSRLNDKLNLKLDNFNYEKQDIIFFSVISWDFRHQRPQHLAQQFSELGHRVFYFNSDFKAELKVYKKTENLYLIDLDNYYGNRIYDVDFSKDTYFRDKFSDFLNEYNIRACSIIVEYPTWYEVCKYLNEQYNFNVVFDYIDDYEGFADTTHSKLKDLTENLFSLSCLTIATSNFLYEKTKIHCDNVRIIRNGTEFDFFNKAFNDLDKNAKKIGYYGAIAEWFDIEKVEYIAKHLPDIEIELIGNVSYDKCYMLSKYKNIKFLGEKSYAELTKYLIDYDVCLIPFRSDIDLIKATNPVKFYEYLSAGKKIVATEIPELLPFKNKYVYLSNNSEEFLKYVKLCLNNQDTLADKCDRIEFAKNNDWSNRCIEMDKYISEAHELVSIIIVTYNNVEYTKQCVNSILNKSAYPNYELIIIDNASVDETPKYLMELEKKYDNIIVKLNDENKGFAAGNNDGLRIAKGKYLILLNNDTLVTRGWINGLIKHIGLQNIGMVCPVTNSIGNEAQIETDYEDIVDMDKFAIEYITKNHNKIYEDINVLAMFCVAFSREVFDKVGLLDENYGVGMFEDDDYSAAVKNAGYKIACVEDVFIHHFGSVSFKKLDDKYYREIFEKNKSYFEKKWNTVWTPHKYRINK